MLVAQEYQAGLGVSLIKTFNAIRTQAAGPAPKFVSGLSRRLALEWEPPLGP